MADAQNPAEPAKNNEVKAKPQPPMQPQVNPQQKKQEASAADLLNLWSGAPKPQPQQSIKQAPPPQQPSPPVFPKSPKVSHTAPPPPAPKPQPPAPKPQPEVQQEKLLEKPVSQKPLQEMPKEKPHPQEIPKEKVVEKPVKPKPVHEKITQEKTQPEKVKGEVISPEPMPPQPQEEQEFLEESEDLGSKFSDFLQELNISWKYIVYGLGCLVLIAGFIYGGIFGYKYLKNRKSQPPPQKQPSEISTESTGLESSEKLGKESEQANADLVKDTGIEASFAIGAEAANEQGIVPYVMVFRRLQNAYSSNVNEMLNKSTDRRGALKSHIALLKSLQGDANEALNDINTDMQNIEIQYEPYSKRQIETDENFFEQLQALNPQTSQEILEEFISVSKQAQSLRARFQALKKIKSYYESGLPKLKNRIRDIELNSEALISGIKVYDVAGSDLNLIVPVEGAGGQKESLDTPAFPFLPIGSSPQPKGNDFITSPGGGFN